MHDGEFQEVARVRMRVGVFPDVDRSGRKRPLETSGGRRWTGMGTRRGDNLDIVIENTESSQSWLQLTRTELGSSEYP